MKPVISKTHFEGQILYRIPDSVKNCVEESLIYKNNLFFFWPFFEDFRCDELIKAENRCNKYILRCDKNRYLNLEIWTSLTLPLTEKLQKQQLEKRKLNLITLFGFHQNLYFEKKFDFLFLSTFWYSLKCFIVCPQLLFLGIQWVFFYQDFDF